jgi:hypothetical protein
MMKLMMGFHDEAQKAIGQGHSWAKVREATQELQGQLRSLKFEDPSDGQEPICKKVCFLSLSLFFYPPLPRGVERMYANEDYKKNSTRRYSRPCWTSLPRL